MYLRTAIVLAIMAVAGNAAEVTIGQGVVSAGKPTTLNVQLAAGSNALTGVQFDLEYDASALDVSVAAGPAATQASKNLATSMVQPGKQRVIVVGVNQTSIPDGVVLVLTVNLKNPNSVGTNFPIRVTQPVATNMKAEKLELTGRGGNVRVSTGSNDK